ncbi:MAG: putative Homoserine/homoserine lactone efflux protein rhtB [Nevskia sp.]|nr:putative Homoserine/homoserine lactone efflux protein rhtB [Nevskia sp.]
MTLQTWLAFLLAAWLICLSPGPGVLSSVTAGMRFGFRPGFWNIAGLQLGALVVLAVVGVGMGALLATSVTAFTLIKWCGALYLVFLGIQQWRAPATPLTPENAALPTRATRGALVLRGFLVNVSNPKGILFTAAVLPQFIDAHAPQWPQYLTVVATMLPVDVICMTGYMVLGVRALRLLRNREAIRWSNRGFGSLFIGAGVALAAFKRSA